MAGVGNHTGTADMQPRGSVDAASHAQKTLCLRLTRSNTSRRQGNDMAATSPQVSNSVSRGPLTRSSGSSGLTPWQGALFMVPITASPGPRYLCRPTTLSVLSRSLVVYAVGMGHAA